MCRGGGAGQGRVRPRAWLARTLDNGHGAKPVPADAPEEKWAIWVAGKTQNTPPDGRPRRIAVKFKKPVTSAMVEFHFKALANGATPTPENVPELLRTFSGAEVKTKDSWGGCPELKLENVFGAKEEIAKGAGTYTCTMR